MDDIVKQAMAKWPNVPACSGWLGLDARGQWWLRDEQAQACGAFASGQPGARGSLLRHEKLAEFIGRNYLAESDGRWYFQNGPQRVYVELESAPWIWRLRCAEHGLQLHSHTGQELAAEQVQQVLLDELVAASYGANFDTAAIAPTRFTDERTGYLELWHGPTSAFKDMALQMLPHLLPP